MLSILVVANSNDWHDYKELEECFINDYYVEFVDKLGSSIEEISKVEFSYEVIFYLKVPETSEISAISRLAKTKIILLHGRRNCYVPIELKTELLPVADKVVLRATAMKGNMRYFKGVDEIVALNAHHIEPKGAYEVVLNGNRNSKVMLGDIVFRSGKNVVFAIRKNNLVVFAADVFSNEALKNSQNCRFLRNLISEMLTGVELY